MTDASPIVLTRQQLYDRVWSRPLRVVAQELDLSSNGLSKICDRLHIPYPGRGYWAKAQAGRAPETPPLPPPPVGAEEQVVIGGGRAASRGPRTRFSTEQRREQLIDAAAELIGEQGLPGLSMKRVAQRVGISEAQAHNYFAQRRDLLIALARRELAAMETRRRSEISRGPDRATRVALSTMTYLREAAGRGALVQVLTQSPEVREALREERQASQRADRDQMMASLNDAYGLPNDVARVMTTVLTAVCLRAGRLVSGGKISLEAAERLTLAITMTGNRDLVRLHRTRHDRPVDA